jgi:arylformamidase
MVDQVRRAIAWIYTNADKFGGDSERLFISGHSSGGHLAAVMLTTDWPGRFSLPQAIIKGGLCVSGIYDLHPVRLSARNTFVKLDVQTEIDLSPVRFINRLACPVVIGIGEFESDEFRRQAHMFTAQIKQVGRDVTLTEAPGLNHFEIIETLADPAGLLSRIALAQMGPTAVTL